jgi:hypothetical protein
MPWYARHWSEWMMLPGRIMFWMVSRRVAASRLLTIRKYPVAGVVLVSTIPKPTDSAVVLVRDSIWSCGGKSFIKNYGNGQLCNYASKIVKVY